MGNVHFSVNNHGSFPNILTFVIFLAPLSEVNSDNGIVAFTLHTQLVVHVAPRRCMFHHPALQQKDKHNLLFNIVVH